MENGKLKTSERQKLSDEFEARLEQERALIKERKALYEGAYGMRQRTYEISYNRLADENARLTELLAESRKHAAAMMTELTSLCRGLSVTAFRWAVKKKRK